MKQMNQSSQQMECLICSPCTLEIKLLKNLLLRRLEREINMLDDRWEVVGQQDQRQGFKQILKIVFRDDIIREGGQCQHRRFQRFLQKRLECSKEVLNFACEKLAYLIAQKNYHLQLVRQQIKHVAETISQGDLIFELGEGALSQSFKTQKSEGEGERERRVARAVKKTQLQNNKNQLLSQSKIQHQAELEPLPSFSSLSFLPMQYSEQNQQQTSHNHMNLGYSYYFAPYPFFFGKRQ